MPTPTGTVKQFKRQRIQLSSLDPFEAVSVRCVAHTGGIPATQTTDGRFGASKKTGETFGTATNITPPTTFTTAQGPIASLY